MPMQYFFIFYHYQCSMTRLSVMNSILFFLLTSHTIRHKIQSNIEAEKTRVMFSKRVRDDAIRVKQTV